MNLTNFSDLISNKDKIIIELGPGKEKCCKEAIGIDLHKKPSVDYVVDLNLGLKFIQNNTVDKIHAYHVLEHIENLEFFMSEIYRVLKKDGYLIGTVPHFSNPYFYSDYTHNKFFGLYSFNYFANQQYFYRQIPLYYNNVNFIIKEMKLIFKSPFSGRNYIKKFFTKFININKFLQEFYEENLIYILPCYEVYFKLKK